MALLRDKTIRETWMSSKLCAMIRRGDLRNDHFQQRKPGQWNAKERDNFIVSVLLNEDFDSIKICEQLTDNGVVLWLIDGLQKSTIIEDFKSGKFRLGKNHLNPSWIEYQEVVYDENGNIVQDEDGCTMYTNVSFDLRGKSYSDLPEKLKEDFNNCPVSIVKHLDCTDEEIGRHIVRYNCGKAMNPAQKIVTYMPKKAKYIKLLSEHAFWNDCANYSDTLDKNGTINKIVCEIIILNWFIDKCLKDSRRMGELLEENMTKEMYLEVEQWLDELLEMVTGETGEMFNTKNTSILFKFYSDCKRNGVKSEDFVEFLNQFDKYSQFKVIVDREYELIKNSGEYTNELTWNEIDGVKSTKDKGIIMNKLAILNAMLEQFVKDNNIIVENINLDAEDNYNSDAEDTGNNEELVDDTIDHETETEYIDSDLDFIRNNVSNELNEEDVEIYESMVDDCVKFDSVIYQKCLRALIALMGYACQLDKDQEFEKWIAIYQDSTIDYSLNQKINFMHFKRDFESYLKGVAA